VDIPETSKKDKSDKKRLDIFSIPFRSDLALWYRCNNRCPHCYLEDKREKKSLTIKEWRKVIEKLYASGIFHLTITGGEPSIYPELKDIIACSRKAGHLTGLISNGRMLGRDGVAESLKQAGLHHVQITLLGQCAETHDSLTGIEGSYEETIRGIRNSIEAGLWTITNTTITKKNIKTAEDICQFIEYLHSLKLRTFAMNTIIVSGKGKDFEHTYSFKELKDILAAAKAKADELKMKFIWYSPTPYCELNPVELGLGVKRCSAAEGAIAVEPDGTVLPCQSCFIPLGNILEKPLEEILLHPVAVRIRERLWVEQRCRDCSNFADCGGGCPLERNAVSRLWDGNEKE
ncbi:MAG: radical SAM protein, partial [Thermoplasmata archaeon]